MKKNLLFYLLLLLSSPMAFCQTSGPNGYLPNYDAPAPEASALGKYVEHPVGTYTGTAKVEIPLFEIKTGRITVPISISYHGSGVKVDEVASRVGIGWVLNAGGVVTRTVKGWPDDVSGYGSVTLNGVSSGTERGYFDVQTSGDPGANLATELGNSQPGPTTLNDLEPDVHFYNFGNKSGKFYFTNRSTAVSIDKDPIKIVGPYNGSHTFVITTEDGIVYTFAAVENNFINNTYPGVNYQYDSAWYLTSIQDPLTGKSVNFYYRTDMPAHLTLNTVKSMSQNSSCTGGGTGVNTNTTYLDAPQVLQRIVYDDGYIQFSAGQSRQDLTGDLAYTEIDQYVNAFDNTPVFRKGFALNYAFTTNGTAQENYRMYLESIQEKGSDGSFLPPYSFTYKSRDQVPERMSPQQDIWGYYNANGVSSSAPVQYPKVYVYASAFSASKTSYLPFNNNYNIANNNNYADNIIDGIERSANPAVVDDGSLIKVTYPTKGYTIYTYETHKFDNDSYSGGGLRIKEIDDYSPEGIEQLSKTYTYANGLLGGPYPQVAYPTSPGNPVSVLRFSLNQAALGSSQGSYVGYGQVIEKQVGLAGSNNGSIMYTYANTQDVPGAFGALTNTCSELANLDWVRANSYFPFFEMESREAQRGVLTQEAYLDPTGKQIKATNYHYLLSSTPVITVTENHITYDPNNFGNVIENLQETRNINAEKMLLDTKTESLYTGSIDTHDLTAISNQVTAYDYVSGGNYDSEFLRSEAQFSSNSTNNPRSQGSPLTANRMNKTTYKYPFDYDPSVSGGVMGAMVSMNYVAPVISSIKTNTRLSGSTQITDYTDVKISDFKYNPLNTSIIPAAVYQFNSIAPVQQPDPSVSVNTAVEVLDPSSPGSLFENRISFNTYDYFGNLSSANQQGGANLVYLWGYNKNKLIAEVKNAALNQVACANFEEHFHNDIDGDYNATNINIADYSSGWYSNDSKTGKKSFLFGGTNYMETRNQLPLGTYIVNYWSKGGVISYDDYYVPFNLIDGPTDPNGWQFHQVSITVTSPDYLELYPDQGGGTMNVDDIRIYPQGAQMKTYTYDPAVGLTSSTDIKNKITYYEYDAHNRLLNVRDQDGNILKSYTYSFRP